MRTYTGYSSGTIKLKSIKIAEKHERKKKLPQGESNYVPAPPGSIHHSSYHSANSAATSNLLVLSIYIHHF